MGICQTRRRNDVKLRSRKEPMVSIKKGRIFSSVVFSKLGPEMMLSYGLERKEGFEEDKNVSF